MRTEKPRGYGLTIVLDKGQLGVRAVEDLGRSAGAYCDFAKIAWGSALITADLDAKIAAYRAAGIQPLFGGTLFEYAYLRDRLGGLFDFVKSRGVAIEVSDGVAEIPRPIRHEWIRRFAEIVPVISEAGGKVVQKSGDWTTVIGEDLAAGSSHVVIEGREIGPVGQPIREDLVDRLAERFDPRLLVFEALEGPQQAWLIQKLGPNVNLGNVLPADLLAVEALRIGLDRRAHSPPAAALEGTRTP